jgi:3-oxoadipate enol-lactonase
MVYRILGEGPPLVWLPGIASTYRVYALVLNRLARRFRTIQYEYPGDRPADGARLKRIDHDHLVEDLVGLIDHLGVDQVYLAGISFGSTIALKALDRAPQRFHRPAVQGAFAHRRFTTAERLALVMGRQLPGTVARLPLREAVLTYNSKMDFPWVIADRWPFYLKENGRTPIAALAHRSSLVARLDLRPLLPRIDADLLLIHGKDDRIVNVRYHDELARALPRSRSVLMPTVGHIPHLTHAEWLADLIGDWMLMSECHWLSHLTGGWSGRESIGCPGGREAGCTGPLAEAESCETCPAANQRGRPDANPRAMPRGE